MWCVVLFFFLFVPCLSTKSGQHNVTLHFFVLPLGSLASIFIGLFSCLKGLCNYINVNEKKYLGDSYMCNGREEKKKTNVTDLSVPWKDIVAIVHFHTQILLLLFSWVAYEKPGFEGHQYLLEEGAYRDWTDWGGYDEELQSLRPVVGVSSKKV